jgi:hypothetical protein
MLEQVATLLLKDAIELVNKTSSQGFLLKGFPSAQEERPDAASHQPSGVERLSGHSIRRPSVVNRQPSTINRQPSTVNRQLTCLTRLGLWLLLMGL